MSVLVYREWTLPDRFSHVGQRAVLTEVFATTVMAFSVVRTAVRFSSLGAGRTVRSSDTGNLGHLTDLLGCQLAAPFHRNLGRTVYAEQVQFPDLGLLWRAYVRRFDLEHTFRFLKQTLAWVAPRVRHPEQADGWTWLVVAAYYAPLGLAHARVVYLRLP